MPSDVRILAPVASTKYSAKVPGTTNPYTFSSPSPEELCQLLSVENKELQAELNRAKIACRTMANLALCFSQIMVDHNIMPAGDRTVRIPRAIYERVNGMTITASPSAVIGHDDIIVRITDRINSPQIEF